MCPDHPNVCQPPPRLFKYVGQRGVKILQTKTLRFTRPSLLNDPFEARPFLETMGGEADWLPIVKAKIPVVLDETLSSLPAQVRQILSRDALLQQMHAQEPVVLEIMKHVTAQSLPIMTADFYKNADAMLGILSLTERPNDLLMWSHYGDFHRGMVLEFDASHAFFNRRRGPDDEFYHLRQVVYSRRRPKVNLLCTEFAELFLTKSLAWEYEAEWRMMSPIQDCKEVSPMMHVQNFPPECLRTVIFGANSSREFRDEVRKTIDHDPEFSHVHLLFAKLQSQEYALEFSETENMTTGSTIGVARCG